jgi:hypothetical protein
MCTIAWEKITKNEMATIRQIARRAVKMAKTTGYEIDYQNMEMDITACHISNPLKLYELVSADDGNFGHDVFGIRKYINRENGELTDCFSPRYSK